jgi:hypothetical protein
MEKDYLILKSAPASRPGEWSDDDYDVLSDGSYVGRIFKAAASHRNALDVDNPRH